MTITQMESFIRLADTNRLTAVANAMHLQASTLSKYIDHMEDEVAAKLFRKTARGLELTQEGGLIYPSVQYIVKVYSDMMTFMNNWRKDRQDSLSVAIAFHQPHLLADLIAFSRIHEDIEMRFSETPTAEIRANLDSMQADLAITYSELIDKKYQHIIPLRGDRIVAAVGKDHPLAERSHISLSELRGDRFILLKDDVELHKFLVRLCISAGFVPRETMEDLRVNTTIRFVEANRGVTLLSEYVVRTLQSDRISILYLDDNPALTMALIYPDHYMRPIVEQLVDFLKKG
jgi:DNA-binding transcriptional LysR family regulator